MRRKIYVTASEMLALREQGMSNHDIAKSLEVSYNTVVRYIGKQGGRMESLEAFKEAPKKAEEAPKETATAPIYEPKLVLERFDIGGVQVFLNSKDRTLKLEMPYNGGITIKYESVPDLVAFLAWAMRNRMEEDHNAD